MEISPLSVVNAYFDSVNSRSIDAAASFLSDDFQSISIRGILGKESLVNTLKVLKTAIPDLHINISDIQVADNVVTVTENVVGTHTVLLDLAIFKVAPIPPTSKAVAFVMGRIAFTVVGDKITRADDITPPSPDVGLPGLLKAIGATLPSRS